MTKLLESSTPSYGWVTIDLDSETQVKRWYPDTGYISDLELMFIDLEEE